MPSSCHNQPLQVKDHVSCLSMPRKHTCRKMELRHLRYFVAVAETENVSRAAIRLHVSQPALSRQIRDLEDELGFALLERSAKSVRLTEAGRVFLTECREVLKRLEDGIKAARTMATGSRAELHVGYAPTLTVRLLPPSLRAFQALMPTARVKLHDLSTEEMLAGLRAGELHLALTVHPAAGVMRGLRFEKLVTDPLRLAVAPTHALGRRRSVSLADLVSQPLVIYSRIEYPEYYEMVSSFFAAIKAHPRVAEEHDGVSSLISAVETGCGVAIVPNSLSCITGPRVKLLSIVPEPPPVVIGAIVPKAGTTSLGEQFLVCLREASRSKV